MSVVPRWRNPGQKLSFFKMFSLKKKQKKTFEIIGDSHAVGRNNAERANVPFMQFSPQAEY